MTNVKAGQCTLLTGHFAIVVQFLLGLSVVGLLVYKKVTEKIKRTWTVWFLDSSKQGASSLLAHGLNITIALKFAVKGDQCVWYLVNFLVDAFLGVALNWLGLYTVKKMRLCCCRNSTLLESGYYGDENPLLHWLMQLLVWCIIISLVKGILLLTIMWPFNSILYNVGQTLLAPAPDPYARLLVVMLMGPCFLNLLIFWIQDTFLKSNDRANLGKPPRPGILHLTDEEGFEPGKETPGSATMRKTSFGKAGERQRPSLNKRTTVTSPGLHHRTLQSPGNESVKSL